MTTTKIENAIMGDIKKDGSTVKVIFDRSMGKEVHLIVDLDDSLGYANGCLGVSTTVDGVDYWISYKWEASKSDDVTVSLDADNVYNVTFNNGSGTVKDADQIAKIAEAAQKEKEAQFQVWWANDKEGEKDDTTKATLVAAYLPDESGETTETTVTTTDAGTTTTPEETTTEATESTTTASAEGTTTAPSETTTTVTTAATTGSESEALYGDINMDGKVDLTDAVMLNKHQAGLVTLTDVQKVNANCDITDGTENITEEDSFDLSS